MSEPAASKEAELSGAALLAVALLAVAWTEVV
jgi:hypothetical protein